MTATEALARALTHNQRMIRAVYPLIDWDEYDREIAEQAAQQERERIRAALDKHVDWHGWTVYGADEVDAILAEPSE